MRFIILLLTKMKVHKIAILLIVMVEDITPRVNRNM
jgi:hypothetical protein